MRILRRIGQLILAMIAIVIAILIALASTAYRAVPPLQGNVALKAGALQAPVTIAYEDHGIPTITAGNEGDAYFALGYVHARDRLFEMEMMRRTGQGRLSEVVGKLGLGTDRFMRTLGLYRRAAADFANLDPAVQRVFQRYADGVNAWLTTRDRPLPIEFQLLWFTPAPWTPVDSLVWQKLMGLSLSGNWNEELLRAALEDKLGPEETDLLFPPPRPGDPPTVTYAAAEPQSLPGPASPRSFADLMPDRLLHEMLRAVTPTLASNAFAVAGSRTTTGKPILANDPHLEFQMPSLWYLVTLKMPEITLTGATVPGVPLHVLGHNDHLAWGITTTHGDTEDLFIEQTEGDGATYQTPQGPMAFTTHNEQISVRFGAPVEIAVRESRHGPVVSDVINPARVTDSIRSAHSVLSLAATILQPDDHSADALYRMARADTVAAFRDALRQWDAPEQNLMFADASSIGFMAAGRVPLRKGGDGTVPAPGWSGDYDWQGWIQFDLLPQIVDPQQGVLANANNRVIGAGGAVLAQHWPEAYRARRILTLLNSKPRLSPDDVAAIQRDTGSLAATEMLPLVLALVQPRNDAERALLESLSKWDGSMARDRAEPLVFAAWMDRLKQTMLADELGDLFDDYYGEQIDVLRAILEGEDETYTLFCDVVGTPQKETCTDRVQLAWNEAIDWLIAHDRHPMTAWRWDDFHQAAFGHLAFKGLPLLDRLLSRHIATPGGEYTINRGSHLGLGAAHPFAHIHGPGMRAVYDLSALDQSRFALAGGQSGHPASPHYDDLLTPWRDGASFTVPATAGAGVGTLTLTPAP